MKKHLDTKEVVIDAVKANKTILFAIIPLLTGYYIHDVIFTENISKTIATMPNSINNMTPESVVYLLAPYIISYVLFFTADRLYANSFPKIELAMTTELTARVMESVKTTNNPFNVNEFMLNLKKLYEVKTLYSSIIVNIIPTILVGLVLLYRFVKIDITYGIMVFCLFLVLVFITITIKNRDYEKSVNNQNGLIKFYDNINDVVTNMDSVIITNQIRREKINLDRQKISICNTYCDSDNTVAMSTLILVLLSFIFMVVIDANILYMYFNGKISETELISIGFLALLFMKYYNRMIKNQRNVANSSGQIASAHKYFSSFEVDNPKPEKLMTGDIKLDNVTIYYGSKPVLNNFSASIPQKSITGVVGDVGSGKSSILKAIMGLVNYTGHIYIGQRPIKNIHCGSVVYINQHPNLFNKTVYYNLNYGSNYNKNEIHHILRQYGMDQFIANLDKGLDTIVGREGKGVSGGQRQLLAIMRAVIQDRSIILLDEPTSSLDKRHRELLMELIKRMKHKTVIIVTHDHSLDSLFDQTIDLNVIG
jgi:ABC-type multidrug transport system fused ATPase/permease subunit